jgi:Protein of unknown function (DUF3293)
MSISPPSPASGAIAAAEARIAELIGAYLAAEYRWELDGHWLNLHIGQLAPEPERWQPQATRFGLLSAWDPCSVPRPEAINRAADQMLHRDLNASGLPLRAAFSSATNRTWREPSWFVADMPLIEFDALSRRYGQLATLAWRRGEPIRLRVDAPRPAGFADDAWVDWLK